VHTLEHRAFLVLIGLVTLAFAWILWPFFGALFWAAVIAIVFHPVYKRLLWSMGGRRNIASFSTLAIIMLIVILPLLIITASLVQEASGLYAMTQSGELDFVRIFQRVFDALPSWAAGPHARFGLTDLAAVREKIVVALTNGVQFAAAEALAIGQSTFAVVTGLGVMLYVLFFVLRDGEALVERVKDVIPLRPELRNALVKKFTVVVRATVKGDILVAILQGALGGVMFWFMGIHASLLWAVLMAFLSLLPAIGAALVWFPVACYLLLTGSVWQGLFLIAYGVLVVGLVDNFLRPLLIGQATKMPDYVVLISTLGGIATFGIHGFIIGPVIAAMFIAVWDIFAEAGSQARKPAAAP
jgi:predicted PurR-regulated permease PerM